MLLAVIVVALAIRLALNPLTISDPQETDGPRSGELADRIDPNTASAAELAAIPSLGEKRARAIVEFRQHFAAEHPNSAAFHAPIDLEQIPGIGAATAEMMEPYLSFPPPPTTQR